MKVAGILTPLIQQEIPDLLNWIRCVPPPCPPESLESIRWFISLDLTWRDEDKKRIISHIRHSHLAKINVIFISVNLSRKESVYLRGLSRNASCDLELGSKNGPNQQFFKSIECICESSAFQIDDSIILLETDAIPVKANWLEELNIVLASQQEFLIAGSRYKGKSSLSCAIKDHLNGNAIYAIGHPSFKNFISGWRSLLRVCVRFRHWIAYDVAIPWIDFYLSDFRDSIEAGDLAVIGETVAAFKALSVDLTGHIVNSSGEFEVSNDYVDLQLHSEKVIVWHSKPLSRTILWSLSINGLDVDILSRNTPLNKRIDALNRSGMLAYLGIDDPTSCSPAIIKYLLSSQSFLRDDSLKSLYLSCLDKPSIVRHE